MFIEFYKLTKCLSAGKFETDLGKPDPTKLSSANTWLVRFVLRLSSGSSKRKIHPKYAVTQRGFREVGTHRLCSQHTLTQSFWRPVVNYVKVSKMCLDSVPAISLAEIHFTGLSNNVWRCERCEKL